MKRDYFMHLFLFLYMNYGPLFDVVKSCFWWWSRIKITVILSRYYYRLAPAFPEWGVDMDFLICTQNIWIGLHVLKGRGVHTVTPNDIVAQKEKDVHFLTLWRNRTKLTQKYVIERDIEPVPSTFQSQNSSR